MGKYRASIHDSSLSEYRASNEREKIKKYEGKKLTGRRVELWYLREGYLVKATRL